MSTTTFAASNMHDMTITGGGGGQPCQICLSKNQQILAKDEVIRAKDAVIAAKDDAIAQKDLALNAERELREQLQKQLKMAISGVTKKASMANIKSASSQAQEEKDALTIYIRNVTESITYEMLHDAFSVFGTIRTLNVVHPKACAFVEFANPDAHQKALAATSVAVGDGDESVLTEKRVRKHQQQQHQPHQQQQQQQHQHQHQQQQQQQQHQQQHHQHQQQFSNSSSSSSSSSSSFTRRPSMNNLKAITSNNNNNNNINNAQLNYTPHLVSTAAAANAANVAAGNNVGYSGNGMSTPLSNGMTPSNNISHTSGIKTYSYQSQPQHQQHQHQHQHQHHPHSVRGSDVVGIGKVDEGCDLTAAC